MERITRVGACSVELEDEVIHVRWVGLPTLAQLQQVYDVLAARLKETGICHVLFDLRTAELPGTELRRYAAQWWRKYAAHVALASYGMSWPVRLMMEMVARAIVLFSGTIHTGNFATEAEARAWLRLQQPKKKDDRPVP